MKPPSTRERVFLTFHKRLPHGDCWIEVCNGVWSRFSFDSEDGQLEWISKRKLSPVLFFRVVHSSNWDPPLPDGMRW